MGSLVIELEVDAIEALYTRGLRLLAATNIAIAHKS